MEDSLKKDHAGVKLPPPLSFLTMILISMGVNRLYPINITESLWIKYLGIVLVVLSFTTILYIAFLFRRHRTEIEPWKTTSSIIKTGPFKYSRNPIYMGMCLIAIGTGLIANSYWVVFSFIPAATLVYYTAIKKEERYLEEKFGQEYLDYKSKVKRW